jgi:DNA-binding CsgD family transcriptional regulator
VKALQTAAWFSCGQRQLDQALERGEWALRAARQTGDLDLVAVSLNLLGAVHVLRREEEQAEIAWNEALAFLPQTHLTRSSILNNSALLSRVRSDSAAAERLFYESIEALPEEDRERQSGNAYVNLAELKFEAGELKEARKLFMRGLRQFSEQHNTENLYHTLEGAADLELRDGHPERAAILLGWVERTRTRLGLVPGAFSVDYVPVNPRVEEALGTERFRRLLQIGSDLTDSEAARFALGEFELPFELIPEVTRQPPIAAEIVRGESPLTPRELEVLRLVAQGKSNQEIADALFISMRTAQTHVTNILGKLDLDSRAALAAYAVRQRLA